MSKKSAFSARHYVYVLCFFTFSSLVLFKKVLYITSIYKQIIIGIIIGHIVTLISLEISLLAVRFPAINSHIYSFNKDPIRHFIFINFRSFILGGWLLFPLCNYLTTRLAGSKMIVLLTGFEDASFIKSAQSGKTDQQT
ncbi:MAG: hypothetical protein HQM03_20725 [Magnetococcales bacterium]|nr:hypothetical protein [Magnetococcales bacterium]